MYASISIEEANNRKECKELLLWLVLALLEKSG